MSASWREQSPLADFMDWIWWERPYLWVYVRALAGRGVVALWDLSSGIVSVELCQLKPASVKTEEVFSGLGCGYLWH